MAQVSRESAGMGLHEHRNAPLWRIELFGVLRVRRIDNGKAFDWFRSRSAAALLAFLAYHSHSHEREMLTELLWPEPERESARRHLRVVLSSLRRVLEPSDVAAGSIILADRRFIALQVGTVTTDVAEFEAALHHASQASPLLQSTLLAQAVELYRGALLPGYYEDWITPQAQRLEELYFVALRKLIARLESDGHYERAIEYAQRGVALSALREEIHHDLMRLYITIDEPMLALRQYRDLERVLALNFDIISGPVPQELLRQIETKARCSQHCAVGHDVASGSTPSSLQETNTREAVAEAVAGATVQAERESSAQVDHRPRLSSNEFLPLQTTCFFGRSEETARLWQLLTQNQTRLVTLTGPGGSGKTRLALEAAQRLKREWHGHVWFVPLADLAEAHLIPEEITSALDLSPLPTLTPLEQGLQFLGAQETPVILVLDNLEHLLPDGAPLI